MPDRCQITVMSLLSKPPKYCLQAGAVIRQVLQSIDEGSTLAVLDG